MLWRKRSNRPGHHLPQHRIVGSLCNRHVKRRIGAGLRGGVGIRRSGDLIQCILQAGQVLRPRSQGGVIGHVRIQGFPDFHHVAPIARLRFGHGGQGGEGLNQGLIGLRHEAAAAAPGHEPPTARQMADRLPQRGPGHVQLHGEHALGRKAGAGFQAPRLDESFDRVCQIRHDTRCPPAFGKNWTGQLRSRCMSGL